MTAARILVIEDDEGIRESLRYSLTTSGYTVLEASDGARGLNLAQTQRPDMILLDLMLPSLSGMEICRTLRKTSRVPIIMLTAHDAEVDKIVGLEVGADDYITKPFSLREVVARVNAVLRRAQSGEVLTKAPADRERLGTFMIDRVARRVTLNGEDVKLAAREFDLLSFLLANPGRVHSRDSLLQNVWGSDFSGGHKTVDVHIRWLRAKFEAAEGFEIVTVRGVGYRLDPMRQAGGVAESESA